MKQDLNRRIAAAPPEKRKLLEKLLKEKGLAAPGEKRAEEPQVSTMVDALRTAVPLDQPGAEGATPSQLFAEKEFVRGNYSAYHKVLESAVFKQQAVYMNLGFVQLDSPAYAVIELPKHMPGRSFARLALEVIGDCDLTGQRLLDVGCGRGGTIQIVREYFEPKETVGVDLTPPAVEFCRERHRYPDTHFEVGDAEDLPFPDARFDVVTNIESSHHYPDTGLFYSEVGRVLTDGGHFLYTTVLHAQRFSYERRLLEKAGLEIERDRDITANVLAACDETQSVLFPGLAADGAETRMANAVGLPGSGIYAEMKAGRMEYRIYTCKKSGGSR